MLIRFCHLVQPELVGITLAMGEVYRPLRLNGFLLTYVIDGALAAAHSRGRCVFVVKTLVLLLIALGFFLSWDKCKLVPIQQGKFLGLAVDS